MLSSLIFIRRRGRGNPETSWRTDPYLRLLLLLCIGTAATAAFALTFKHDLEGLFGSPLAVGIALMATAGVLTLSKWTRPERDRIDEVRLWEAALIGLGQGLAVIPGLSRSGTTITLGLLLRLDRELAARFSFLLFIPAILGAALLQFDPDQVMGEPVSLLAGTLCAGLSGYLALKLLLKVVRVGKFWIFAPYCFVVGMITVFRYLN
jgi:undecaprenyl-diphosphatase